MNARLRAQQTSYYSWRPLRLLLDALGYVNVSSRLINEYMRFAYHLAVHHGYLTTVKVLKDLDSRTKLVVAGQRVERSPFGGVWLKTTPNGLPRRLPVLRYVVDNHPLAATCVVAMVRLLTTAPDLNVETITSPNIKPWPPVWIDSFKTFVEKQWINTLRVDPGDWHTSTKAGPNGPAAVLSSGIDAIALAMSPAYQGLFEQACQSVKFDYLLDRYRLFIDNCLKVNISNTRWPGQITQAKLAFLSDKAGKTRVIYILSYWWQELLQPLHRAMFGWLRQQPQDGTFDQRKTVDVVKQWTKEGKPLWSFDLTAATDRWPKLHQAIVIQAMAGHYWVKIWLDAMGIPPYSYPHQMWFRYAVGQPMGAYASWAALACTHHYLIRWCASRAGVPWDCYVVLGDDVVISNKAVSDLYKEALTDLGVTISQAKSVIWENQITGSSAEFAKQVLRDGQDLTAFSPALLKEIWDQHQWWKVLELFQELKDRSGPVVYKLQDGNLLLPTLSRAFYETFTKSQKEKLLVLLGDPQGRRCLISEVKDGNIPEGGLSVPDPWAGIDELTYLTIKSEMVTQQLFEDVQKLMKLRDDLKEGRSGSKLRGWLTDIEGHPIWAILDRLEEAVLHAQRYIVTGDTSLTGDFVQLHMDVEFLSKLVVHGATYNEWKDYKSRKLKAECNMTINLHRKIRLLDAPATESDWSDW